MQHEEHHSPHMYNPHSYRNSFYARWLPHPAPPHDDLHSHGYQFGRMTSEDKKMLLTVGIGAVGAIAIVAVAVAMMRRNRGIPV